MCLLILFIYEKFVTVLRTYKLDKCLHLFWLLVKCKSILTLSFLHVFILENNYLHIFFILFRAQTEIFFLPHLFFSFPTFFCRKYSIHLSVVSSRKTERKKRDTSSLLNFSSLQKIAQKRNLLKIEPLTLR